MEDPIWYNFLIDKRCKRKKIPLAFFLF